MKFLGTLSLYYALAISLIGVALSVVAGKVGSSRFLHASRFSAYATFGGIALASSVLMHAILTHDFSIQYVQSFSDKTMPLFYLIGAFWGGQAGSLLFWTSTVAGFTVLALVTNRATNQDFMPWVTAVCLAVVACLLMILVFASNPFDGFAIVDDPTRGKGLNPLLQTPKMVMHPPCLLAGLATMTIPYAFAMAALITGNFSNAWVKAARKWILVPWLLLSVGNMLGGMWAYEELGWGGYWAWDPVENAAFFPWLMTSALLHSIMIQERRGMLKRWNIGLMISSFVLTLFGTYITRSGLIASVHSFAQSEIGDYFLALLLSVIAVSSVLFLWRWRSLGGERRLDSPVSREATFIFNNWLLVAMTVIVLFGTMWPKIKEGIFGQEVAIGPPWFNRWMVPMGILLLLLMGVGAIIPWRRTTWKSFKSQFSSSIAITALLSPLILGAYWWGRGKALGVVPTPLEATYAILTVVFAIFATVVMLVDMTRALRARRKKHEESLGLALLRLFEKQRRRYGGYVVHLGIVCAYVAFAGNALKIEQDLSMVPGQSIQIGDYTLTYQGLREETLSDKVLVIANMTAFQGGEHVYDLTPGKAIFHSSPNMPTSEIDIKTTPLEDLYVALVSYDGESGNAAFKVFVGPFTWWFWFGGTILLFGTLICLWPAPGTFGTLRRGPGLLVRAGAFGALASLCLVPLGVWTLESHTRWGNASRHLVQLQAPDSPTAPTPHQGEVLP